MIAGEIIPTIAKPTTTKEEEILERVDPGELGFGTEREGIVDYGFCLH